MADQDEKQCSQPMLEVLNELKAEVNSLRAEVGRIEGTILRERMRSVEEALMQNRLLMFADQLQDELAEDIEKVTRPECENQKQCIERFSNMANENLKIIKDLKPKEAIADFDSKIDKLGGIIEKAKDAPCGICHLNFQKKLRREKRALQTVVLVENTASRPEAEKVVNIDFLVETLLEPLANSARLTILMNLFEGKKSFSKLAEITSLKGGHLMFHLKKLLDAQLVAQENNKGDYIITQRGVGAIQKITSLQAK